MQRIYLEQVLDNALLLDDDYDFIVVHDPQPAAMLSFCASASAAAWRDTKWIWRCHIDLTDANPTVWEFFRPFVELHDASVWTMPEFVPASLEMDRIVHAPPCIDPLSVKNLDLAMPFCQELTRQYGIDVHRPIVCQVSRFDPWKDPVGVIEAFRIVREQVPDAQLVLAGSMATDDPEGFRVWEDTEAARAGDRDIHLLSNLHQVGAVQINAFQRIADVVVQKSLREGFGLTVSEALWKGRPVIGGRAGGIKLQIRDGYDGYLVDSVEECAAAHHRPPRRPRGRRRDGRAGQGARPRELPVDPRARGLAAALRRAARHDARHAPGALPVLGARRRIVRRRRAAPAGIVSALLPLVSGNDTGERQAWIAAAIDDDDRAAVAAGAATVTGLDLRLLDLDPALHRLHYDVVSNATLWFLHHGLFDLARRPALRPPLPRGVGRVRRGEPAFADAVARTPAEASRCSSTTTSSRWCRGMVRAARPDLRVAHFTHTPFCGPNSIRVLPTDIAEALCSSMAAVPSGFHTERWARGVRGVGPRGPRARPGRRPYATPLGPDPDALADVGRLARHRGRRQPSSTSSSATGSSCCAATGSTRRRTSCAASTRTTGCSRPIRSGAGGWCSSRCSTGHARASPSTSRTSRRSTRSPQRVNERWATDGLAAGGRRHPRRLRADHRRVRPATTCCS